MTISHTHMNTTPEDHENYHSTTTAFSLLPLLCCRISVCCCLFLFLCCCSCCCSSLEAPHYTSTPRHPAVISLPPCCNRPHYTNHPHSNICAQTGFCCIDHHHSTIYPRIGNGDLCIHRIDQRSELYGDLRAQETHSEDSGDPIGGLQRRHLYISTENIEPQQSVLVARIELLDEELMATTYYRSK